MSDGVIVCYTKCWNCMLNQAHMSPPQWHTWADLEDIDHAVATGQPDPSTNRCGCACADVDAVQPAWDTGLWQGPDHDDDDYSSTTWQDSPCPECGESGACAWDAEGRPLVHAIDTSAEDE